MPQSMVTLRGAAVALEMKGFGGRSITWALRLCSVLFFSEKSKVLIKNPFVALALAGRTWIFFIGRRAMKEILGDINAGGKGLPILVKAGRNVARSKSRVEGIAQKCSCKSTWCKVCWPRYHGPAHMDELKDFDWRRTRHITGTVNPKLYKNGKEAHRDITKRRLIPNFIRNLQRGSKFYNKKTGQWKWKYKPIKITKYKWFLEWHDNGYPHYHILIEVEGAGKAGMIGQTVIHYYWLGVNKEADSRIHEGYFRSKRGFKEFTGYFKKHGYLEKNKAKQGRLPPWALNEKRKIRRSGSNIKKEKSTFEKVDQYFKDKDKCDIIDIRTGEIIRPGRRGPKKKKRTYQAILDNCGQRTRVRIFSEKTYIEGIVKIPYKKFREKLPGTFEEHRGYCFNLNFGQLE